ncbi:unnamed protein product (macronuclear) [Paramecium tetraurelia]|uniref:Uncharacterized protein n=1 Tax=Paramecium tetraurelia TaxID=5888 RepID=A0CKU7_PARTE|nr:uncharacterized protein GSPATT00007960001 [Paramecium tetraurelia]CAK71414.1 unnamed protein product [Paramecium tetraurelia]|eukprot:XP_001438811.1 hypothetical protein (macronuclear) [Paramecium tetraurelia strain d4-2]
MRVAFVLLVCLVLCQSIPVHKKFLQLDGQESDVEYTSENLQVVEEKSQSKDVQILAAQESDLMINQLDPSEKSDTQQSLDDETPLNTAYFEDEENNNEIIEDASQNIVEDLKLIGQSENNNIIDENHQVIDTQQNINDNNENYVSDTMNVNDEIQQELSDQQNGQETINNEDNYYDDSIENNDTLQVSDSASQQQLIAQTNDVPDLSNMDQDQITQQFTQPQYEVQPNQIEQTNQQDQTIIVDNQLEKDENQPEAQIIVVQEQTQMQSDNSSPKQVNIQQEITSEDPNNISDINEEQTSQCIELYSQCYYKGETMKACNDLGQMKDFPYEIKSMKIPYGTTLTIYDHPNYEGERHTFSKNEECLANVIVLTQITI